MAGTIENEEKTFHQQIMIKSKEIEKFTEELIADMHRSADFAQKFLKSDLDHALGAGNAKETVETTRTRSEDRCS